MKINKPIPYEDLCKSHISAWTRLVGYISLDVEEKMDPRKILEYMRELKHEAMAPLRKWYEENEKRTD